MTMGCAGHLLAFLRLGWPPLAWPSPGPPIGCSDHSLVHPWSGPAMGCIGELEDRPWSGVDVLCRSWARPSIRSAGHGLGGP